MGKHIDGSVLEGQALPWRQVWRQQWFMTKFCFRTTPGFMLFHIFEALKLQVSIFIEFTLAINYILRIAETHGDFMKILWCMGILMAAIALSTVTFAIYKHYVLPKAQPVLMQAFRMEIYEKAKELDLASYDDRDFYEHFILATDEADQCIERYLASVELGMGRLLRLLLSAGYSVVLNPVIFVFVIFELPLELFIVKRENQLAVRARMERVAYEQKREYGNRVFYLADYAKDLRLNPEMKKKCQMDYGQSNREISNIHQVYGRKVFAYQVCRESLLEKVILQGVVWTVLLYQMLVLKTLSCADMITSRQCIFNVTSSGQTMIGEWRRASENAVYIERIRRLLDMEPAVVSEENRSVPEGAGDIKVEHVDFSYPSGKPVLKDVSLHIRAGQKIALVGYNGSGKTTLVKLLLRLYDPTGGQICYQGQDIRTFNVKEYRRAIGSVFQDFKIYAASLKENVLMDVSDQSKEENYEVERALFDAHFMLEDQRLVYQTETPLTTEFEKDGVNLSGGESQKVAIARTLYRRQSTIIMDEPSSALDPLAEYRLNQELNEIAKDKTVIFISHRLSTTRDADCIYMMEDGRIIESGTHEQLLARGGKYADMWHTQACLYAEGM